jgi:putative flippase GtrA
MTSLSLCDAELKFTMWQSRRIVSWVLLGLTGSLAELVLLRGLLEVWHWALPLATAVAAEVLIVIKFLVADRWVFQHPWPTVARLMRYHGASAGALVIYWLVVNGLGIIVGLMYVEAFIIGTAAAFVWSLLTNFLWVWAQPARSHAE